MELWDIYDKDRIKTGRLADRHKSPALQPGEYHLVVHICLFGPDGRMLIQQRQPFKSGWSNLWDVSVGGSAIAGDDSPHAAMREVREELGLTLDLTDMRPVLTKNFKDGFDDFYLVDTDAQPADCHLQYEEVQQVRFADADEICRMIDEGVFIPYPKDFIRLLFTLHGNGGTLHEKPDTTAPVK